jgi:SpoVK/Ycf46/Vps4 family AAA+-type ATPase
MSKKYLSVYNGGSIYANDRADFSNQSKSGIFDDKTEELVERIAASGKNRCSRAYALVGIPGTGKSFIMNKLASDDTSSAIIVPCIGDDGLNYDMQRTINVILRSLPQEHVFILLDDFDKCVGSNSDRGTINQMLIEFFTNLHRNCPGGDSHRTFTLIATMNNPKLLNNAIIKRSERFDEVIEIGLPQPEVYGKRLDSLKKEGDLTDFTSFKFRPIYRYMRHKVITLADLGNIYDILRIHRKKSGDAIRYTVMDLIYAVRFIGKNRSSASKEYEI